MIFSAIAVPRTAQDDSASRVRITMIPARTNVTPGDVIPVAVIMDHDDGWHTHPNNPDVPEELEIIADLIVKTEVSATANPNLTVHRDFIQWPEGEEVLMNFTREPVRYRAYHWRTIVFVPVSIHPDAELGPTSTTLTVRFQACDDSICLPESLVRDEVAFHITTPEYAQPESDADATVFADFDQSVWQRIGIDPAAARDEAARGVSPIILFGGIGLALVVILVLIALVVRR